MSNERILTVGDIISIGNSPKHFLVTRSENRRSGDWGLINEIDCVEIINDKQGESTQTIQCAQSNFKHFYFENGRARGRGEQIKNTDVTIVGTSTLFTYVTTTCVMENVKYYNNE